MTNSFTSLLKLSNLDPRRLEIKRKTNNWSRFAHRVKRTGEASGVWSWQIGAPYFGKFVTAVRLRDTGCSNTVRTKVFARTYYAYLEDRMVSVEKRRFNNVGKRGIRGHVGVLMNELQSVPWRRQSVVLWMSLPAVRFGRRRSARGRRSD